jgi:hypothetical protein
MVRCTDYRYDQFLNLASQNKRFYPVVGGSLVTSGSPVTTVESYQYDELQRLQNESRTYTNMAPATGTVLSEGYSYDDVGNILSKTDYSPTYTYGDATRPGGAGPHAVSSVVIGVNTYSFTYDQNGNMVSGPGYYPATPPCRTAARAFLGSSTSTGWDRSRRRPI